MGNIQYLFVSVCLPACVCVCVTNGRSYDESKMPNHITPLSALDSPIYIMLAPSMHVCSKCMDAMWCEVMHNGKKIVFHLHLNEFFNFCQPFQEANNSASAAEAASAAVAVATTTK